ncbi:putative hemagglutination repeat-containing protein [Roseibium sp. TrichSKD4]|uniref:DUF637 domain-containing protein n=1 Tax=Roseibium sp. TrichSKD4 TaxID=744980 RepID=UPI0001E56D4C|nr:DUF637 domain-containing protein [Roseibium sp. TrichSKD4]EFO33272.1 putative hemagglutination repeat-containing protein [Roseibium sp. TrichSKD4]
MSAITSGLEAFTSTFLVESLDAAVAGDFDIGDILKDSAFSGVSAGLTAGINLETFVGNLPKDSVLNDALISGFGGLNPKLAMKGILDGAIDGAISSGLSSAVYGTDFLEGFSSSMVNTLVNLTLADVQYEIGELGVIRGPDGKVIETKEGWGEGSFPHAILHGLAGCAAGAVQNGGQGCAAGAAGGIAQSIFAGTLGGSTLTGEQQAARAQFLGALAGYIFSGGDGSNVSTASGVALSGFVNNYLTHQQFDSMLESMRSCDGDEECRASVYREYLDNSAEQQHALAMCGNDLSCQAPHLQAMAEAQNHPFWQQLMSPSFQSDPLREQELQAHQVYLGFEYPGWTATPDATSAYSAYPEWAASNCQGVLRQRLMDKLV